MAVISFSKDPEEVWCKAGWAFRQVMDDVLAQHRNALAVGAELEGAKAVKGLIIYLMDSELAADVTDAIRDVVKRILTGEVRSGIHDQKYGDATTVMQYHESFWT